MRHRFTTLVVVCCCAVGAALSQVGGAVAHPARAANSCTYGRVLGATKCLMSGEYCSRARAARRAYERYGFACVKRDRNGRWHLEAD